MNEIVNKFLLVRDKFMLEMHLKQPGFTYSACGPFTKNIERTQKFMQTGNTNYIYKNDLDKACFQHDMTYGKYKDLTKRTQSNKVLEDKAFQIASNLKYDGYQRGLASMVPRFLIKNMLKTVDFADMQLISKYNKGIRFLLCVIDVFSKYAWVVSLKNKKRVTIVKYLKVVSAKFLLVCFRCKREYLSNEENIFLFHFKTSFRS